MGSNNKFGQLGHGDNLIKLKPTLIEFFLRNNEKIVQISCGLNHVLAKNEKGKIYSWGMGKFGQLRLGQLYTESYIPKLIKFPDNILNIYQVSCGYRSSYFLTK
jgi:alpha-tubulin suppressor-like RCC1 family protein